MTNPRIVTSPEPTQQPATPTGRGVHWPDVVAKIEREGGPVGVHPDAETRRRVGEATPQTVKVPAVRGELRLYTLADDEQPVTVPARPYTAPRPGPVLTGRFAEALNNVIEQANRSTDAGNLDRQMQGLPSLPLLPFPPRSPGYPCGIKPAFGPPTPEEVREIADSLNAHGGFDETFVAELLRQAVKDQPAPAPAPEPVTYETLMEAMGKFGPLPLAPPEPIKLTREQWDAVPKTSPNPYGGGVIGNPFGVPVELVETVEESTPYRLWLEQAEAEHGLKVVAELPGGAILGNPAWLVEADREFVAHVNDGVDRAAVLDAVRAAGGVIGPLPIPTELRPRPWWRRALDRVRRWTR